MIEIVCISETSVSIYRAAWCYIAEDSHFIIVAMRNSNLNEVKLNSYRSNMALTDLYILLRSNVTDFLKIDIMQKLSGVHVLSRRYVYGS
jgi:hypothetical protein